MDEDHLIRENQVLRLMTAKLSEEKSCLEERMDEMTQTCLSTKQECENIRRNAQTFMRLMFPRYNNQLRRLENENRQLKESNKYISSLVAQLQRFKTFVEESNGTIKNLMARNKVLCKQNLFLKESIQICCTNQFDEASSVLIEKIEEGLKEMVEAPDSSDDSDSESAEKTPEAEPGPSASKKRKIDASNSPSTSPKRPASSTSEEESTS